MRRRFGLRVYNTIGEYFRRPIVQIKNKVVVTKNKLTKIEGLSTLETVILYRYLSMLYEQLPTMLIHDQIV